VTDRTPFVGQPFHSVRWTTTEDGQSLHVPAGSSLQLPYGRRVLLALKDIRGAGKEGEPFFVDDMRSAPDAIRVRYAEWRSRLPWNSAWKRRALLRNSLWRGFDLWEEAMPRDPFQFLTKKEEQDDLELSRMPVPRKIDIRFLPISRMRDPKESAVAEAAAAGESEGRQGAVVKTAFTFMGFDPGPDERVLGLILASDADVRASDKKVKKVWYKCGYYVSFGNYVPFPVSEESGMTIGKLWPDGA